MISGFGKKLVLKCDFSKFKELIAGVGSFKVFLRENDFYENDSVIIAFSCVISFVREQVIEENNTRIHSTRLVRAELMNRELKIDEVEVFREVLRR